MIKMKKKISLVIMAFAFVACGENDTPKRITPIIEQEEYVIVNETCHQCKGYGAFATMYGPMRCNNCNGQGTVSVKRKINRSSNISFKGGTFVKTNYKCKHNSCDCSGYWGYKHSNGTYEGKCQNSDGWGHTCNHSPEDHGLKSW